MATPLDTLPQDLIAKLNAFFARPQGTAQDLKDQPDFFRGAEFFDEGSKRSYIKQAGTGFTADGKPIASGGFVGYDFAPGMYKDNAELNSKPYQMYDSMGKFIGTDTFRGMSAKWDTLNIVAPLAMMAAGIGATIAGMPAAAATGVEAATVGGADVAAATAGGEVAAGGGSFFNVGMPGVVAPGSGFPVGTFATPVLDAAGIAPVATFGGTKLAETAAFLLPAGTGGGGGGVPSGGGGGGGGGVPTAPTGGGIPQRLGDLLTSKLGQMAISAAVTGLAGGAAVNSSRTAPPPVEKPTEMPDPDPTSTKQQRARRESFMQQLARRGRASTVLTSPRRGAGGKLGG